MTTCDQRPGRWCSRLRLRSGALGAVKGVALDRTALQPWINFVLLAPAAGVACEQPSAREINPWVALPFAQCFPAYRRCRRAVNRRSSAKPSSAASSGERWSGGIDGRHGVRLYSVTPVDAEIAAVSARQNTSSVRAGTTFRGCFLSGHGDAAAMRRVLGHWRSASGRDPSGRSYAKARRDIPPLGSSRP